MALTIYGIPNYPHDFLVTKVDAPLEQCAFLLDFSRELQIVRWLFGRNKLIGLPVGLFVPVVHIGEREGGYVIGVSRGEPYFSEIPKLWKKHSRSTSSRTFEESSLTEIIGGFAIHFPDDCS